MGYDLKRLKDRLNSLLAKTGFRIVSTRVQPWQSTLAAGLARLAARNLRLRTLIDVGAADGGWTRQALSALPSLQNQLLVEAQPVHRAGLDEFHHDFPHANIATAVAGPTIGTVSFNADSPWAGAASVKPQQGGSWAQLPQTTLDHEVSVRKLRGPFLIKLDVHGYEQAVLDGAQTVLAHTEALIIECYNVEIGGEALRFPKFCLYMESLGYRAADLWDPLYIGRDRTLWQFDLLFLRTAEVAVGDPSDA